MKDKAETIIRETISLVAANGFHGSPASLIAKRANVGTGTIYRYFENKEKLIVKAKDRIMEDMGRNVFSGEAPPSFKARFELLMLGFMTFFLENETYYRFFEQYLYSPFGQGQLRLAKEDNRFALLFNEAKEEGVIKDVDNVILFALSLGPALFMIEEHYGNGAVVDQRVIQIVIDSTWNTIKT